MCSNSNVHILNGCPLQPSPNILQGLDSPDSSSSIEPKKVKKNPIHLLLHLKMEAEIDVLKPGQQVLIFVDKWPPGLN